jgi:hypothetical protein
MTTAFETSSWWPEIAAELSERSYKRAELDDNDKGDNRVENADHENDLVARAMS